MVGLRRQEAGIRIQSFLFMKSIFLRLFECEKRHQPSLLFMVRCMFGSTQDLGVFFCLCAPTANFNGNSHMTCNAKICSILCWFSHRGCFHGENLSNDGIAVPVSSVIASRAPSENLQPLSYATAVAMVTVPGGYGQQIQCRGTLCLRCELINRFIWKWDCVSYCEDPAVTMANCWCSFKKMLSPVWFFYHGNPIITLSFIDNIDTRFLQEDWSWFGLCFAKWWCTHKKSILLRECRYFKVIHDS